MKLKSTIYWLLSFLALILCLIYTRPDPKPKNETSTELTSFFKSALNSFYFSDKQFHVTVVGQSKLEIQSDQITSDISDYNVLVIEDFQYKQNIETSLNWQVIDVPHKLILNQNKKSINRINFNTDDPDKITDLHLSFTFNRELGTQHSFQDEISFQSIRLDYASEQNPFMANFSNWTDFTAIKFNAINGYSSGTDLHLKSLVLRLSCWLMLTTLLFWLCKVKGSHLIATVAIAWLIGSYFFISNHTKQHHQITQSFSADQHYLNQVDIESHEVAQLIINKLTSSPSLHSSSDRLVLIGSTTFFKLRLKHYLMNLNVGTYSNLRRLIDAPIQSKLNIILVGKQLKYCKNFHKYVWLNTQVELIHFADNFCLMGAK